MIIGFIIIAVIVIWCISVRRRLVGMNENINHAMSQIGIQLSSRFDALTALVDILKGYDAHESQTLMETINTRRSVITATSTPYDVQKQEHVISEVLDRVSMITPFHPEIQTNEKYAKCMNALQNYEKMMRTSRLIYNDNVTRLNRELRMFPSSLLVGIFGFHEREYLEAAEEADMPSTK